VVVEEVGDDSGVLPVSPVLGGLDLKTETHGKLGSIVNHLLEVRHGLGTASAESST